MASDKNTENMIEFISGEHFVTISFTESSKINRMKKLYASDRGKEFKYFIDNPDGSICCKIPKKWIKINPGKSPDAPKKEMSEEQKARLRAGLQKYREQKQSESWYSLI